MTDEELADKYAEEYFGESIEIVDVQKIWMYKHGFLAGLKARPKWHKVADGDLPEVDNRIVLCICGNGYIDRKCNYIHKLLTRKEFPLFQPVIAWCELPTFDKE